MSYLQKGKPFEATKAIYQALRHGLDDPVALKTLGDTLYVSREYVVASECYKVAIDNLGDEPVNDECETKLNLIYELEAALDLSMKMVSDVSVSMTLASTVALNESAGDIYAARPIGFTV